MTHSRFRRLLSCALLVVAAGALSACVSANGAIRDVTDSDKFATICRTEPIVHAGFVVIAPSAGISARVIRAEAAAHAIVLSVCTNPPQNVSAALVTAAEAYARVLEANAEAAASEGG